jgi:hypothetical protein
VEDDGGDSIDTDGDGELDFRDDDNDGDHVSDVDESPDCALGDTDGDGAADFMDTDADGDGIGDLYEGDVDTDEDGTPDFRDLDADGDGLPDADERGQGDAPADTDGDGVVDFRDHDSDGDWLPDADEPAAGTDPTDEDTDGDGYVDGAEAIWGTDPADGADVPDGLWVVLAEGETVEAGFAHTVAVDKVDVAFVLDQTAASEAATTALVTVFATLATSLSEGIADLGFGVARFEDYAFGSYGSPGADKPFTLRQPVTTDVGVVQATFASLNTASGGDGPESGFEALHQAVTGAGYDQDCDLVYDALTDVPPYVSDAPGDVFAGAAEDVATYDGGGTRGGMGFRDGAFPIVVFATDNYLRDPEADSRNYNGTPGGCDDAGASDVAAAFLDLGARFVGVSVNGTIPLPQLETLAEDVGSTVDTDDDGLPDAPSVLQWSASNAELRDGLVEMVTRLVSAADVRLYDRVEVVPVGDDHGFAIEVSPAAFDDVVAGDELEVDVTFRGAVPATAEDEVYRFALDLRGDFGVFRTVEVVVLVPGT